MELRARRWLVLLAGLVLAVGCGESPTSAGGAEDAGAPPDAAAPDALLGDRAPLADGPGDATRPGDAAADGAADTAPSAGEILALTYNVAGLPWGLSSADPARNTPLISPLLNPFDLVLIQEDFGFSTQLASAATHEYKSVPAPPQGAVNDGLTVFSRYAFPPVTRVKWTACHGVWDSKNDCLAPKGFLKTEVTLAPGVSFDLYDIHLDAGGDDGDRNARAAQVEQLLVFIAATSTGRALVVGGDTNLSGSRPADLVILDELLAGAGLTDSCRALDCGDEGRIDRIMYRSADDLELHATAWRVDDSFVDAEGAPLSDHEPVAVTLAWSVP